MDEERTTYRGLIIGVVIAILVIAGIAVFALSQRAEAPNTTDNQADTPTGSTERDNEVAPNPSERMTISYTSDGFEPKAINVKKGTVITVKNETSRNVQFASDEHPTHRDNPELNIPTLAPGESEAFTVTSAGIWGYHNHLDEEEAGTITVTE